MQEEILPSIKKNIVINEDNFLLLQGDCFKLLKKLQPKSVDMIFADPPYFCPPMEYLVIQVNKYLLTKEIGINL